MEWRSSSRWKPSPEVALAWGSQSTRRVLKPSIARQAARLMAVVVLPTPPFWLTTPRIFPMAIQSKGKGGWMVVSCAVENGARLWKAFRMEKGERWANVGRGRSSRQGVLGENKSDKNGLAVENFHNFWAVMSDFV